MTYQLADGVPARLGLADDGAEIQEAPAAVLGLLPRGPALDIDAAQRPWVYPRGRTAADTALPPGAVR